jgi:hypothetical protein
MQKILKQMSTFALVSSTADSDLLVQNVHINLFILPGLLGRYRMLVEIGVHFACATDDGKAHELEGFELDLPFIQPDRSPFEDVSARLTDATNLRMIFGKCKEDDGLITWSTGVKDDGSPVETTAKLVPVRRDDGTKCLNKDPAASRSFWHFKVNQKINKTQGLYIRLRFPIAHQRIWRWHRGIFGRNGAFFDLRFQNVRSVDPGIVPIEKLSEIGGCNVHVVVPQWMESASLSPTAKYTRLLEGRVWEPYLGCKTDFWRREMFAVYAWEERNVSADNPFRLFGTFRTFPGTPKPLFFFFAVTMVACATTALIWVIGHYSSSPSLLGNDWDSLKTHIWKLISALGILGSLTLLQKYFKAGNFIVGWVARVIGYLENFLMRRPQ